MSRSGYCDDLDDWQLIKWRGQVESAIRGKRGQRFLRELLVALEEMQEKALIATELQKDGDVCALGAVGVSRNLDVSALDPEDSDAVAAAFDIAPPLAREIAYLNDEAGKYGETPKERWKRMRNWVGKKITVTERPDSTEGAD